MIIKKINNRGIIILEVFFKFFLIFNIIIIIVIKINMFWFKIVNYGLLMIVLNWIFVSVFDLKIMICVMI